MAFKLKNIVPWGRSFAEYRQMFSLSNDDLTRSIIDCGGGPSSFNVEMNNLGNRVVSCDPIYQFTAQEIENRILETYPTIIKGLETDKDRFVWGDIATPEELGQQRLAAMKLFLADLERGLEEQRYLNLELPNLTIASDRFDLALCSHLLFTYSEQLSFDFHLAAIQEMCRVAKEVRVFPLLENFTGETSCHLEKVQKALQVDNYQVEIVTVDYEFQKNGNQMLVITPNY